LSKVKVVLNKAGVRALLKSSEAREACMEQARAIAGRAGSNYETGARNYPERSGAAVYPANAEGFYDNLQNNTLLRSMK